MSLVTIDKIVMTLVKPTGVPMRVRYLILYPLGIEKERFLSVRWTLSNKPKDFSNRIGDILEILSQKPIPLRVLEYGD